VVRDAAEGEIVEELRTWIEALGPLLLGIAGLWAAHSYQRGRRLRLAEDRVGPYGKLWWAMSTSRASRRSSPLTPLEAQHQLDRLRAWYHDDHGGAMLLPIPTLKMLLLIMQDLEALAALGVPPDGECGRARVDECRRRSTACLAAISLLRTQLKIDLDVYDVDEGPQLRRPPAPEDTEDEADHRSAGRAFLRRACVDVDNWGRAPRWWHGPKPFHWHHYDGRRSGEVTPLGRQCPNVTEEEQAAARQLRDTHADEPHAVHA
jgi:hypothetical protein